MNDLITVDFRGDTLFAVKQDETVFVAIKPICDRLGILWSKQRERINRDQILSEGSPIMGLPSLGGIQETIVLRLDLINGWLFTIDESRVKDEETRQRILSYKRECYQVLFEHFHGVRQSAPIDHFAAMAEQRHALDLVREARMNFGPARARILWHELGLPPVPELPEPQGQSPQAVLQALYAHETPHGSIGELLAQRAEEHLLEQGIRLEGGGFWLAQSHPSILAALRQFPRFNRTLLKLSGSIPSNVMKFANRTHRAVFVPFSWQGDAAQ